VIQPALKRHFEGEANVSDDRPDTHGAPRRGNLLFVDPDDFLLDMIASGLSLSRPRWGVIATHGPAEALRTLKGNAELDAVVTEIVFDRSADAGRAFVREVGARWPEIPIFAMTRLDRDEIRGLDTTEYIAKPPDIDFLVGRIDRIIRRRRESQVRGIALTTFLQILEIDQKTCTVHVSHAGSVGEIHLRDGRLVDARLGALRGKDALFGMLSMREHTLRVVDSTDALSGIAMPLASLLMEWSVREDHTKRGELASREEDE
jgi:DNA-binding response OmpR family regulator